MEFLWLIKKNVLPLSPDSQKGKKVAMLLSVMEVTRLTVIN